MASGSTSSSREWLEKALADLRGQFELCLDLDADVISGLVSYCEFAPPEDAIEYLHNIVGEEASQTVIPEYLRRRGYVDPFGSNPNEGSSKLVAYVKPPNNEISSIATKKQINTKEGNTVNRNTRSQTEPSGSGTISKEGSSVSKKKKSGKIVSLVEAAKGSVIFQKGKPCSCQARRHKLVSNCLACGKIVCEQESEGPCSFCGALVLREGSTYAGLESTVAFASDSEAAAEAFAKRLVDYDRNSAARTVVIDDQSDYYEIEGNTWLSKEEKDILIEKQKEIEQAEEMRKSKVIVTFDLVGRKVMVKEDEASELESECRILRPINEQVSNRIKPNPSVRVQPIFVDTGPSRNPAKSKQPKLVNGLCLEVSGRVQHEEREVKGFKVNGQKTVGSSLKTSWRSPSSNNISLDQEQSFECSLDYN